MVLEVIKRDGRVVSFELDRIVNAINSAIVASGFGKDLQISSIIAEKISNSTQTRMKVSEIQDAVEELLMQYGFTDVAKSYIIYRNKRDMARKSESNAIISDIIAAKKNDITRENANMNADTPAGMMMKVSSERTKEYVDDFLLSDDVKKLVDDNILHIHDKDYYPTRALPVSSIQLIRFWTEDSERAMVSHVRQRELRLQAYSAASLWKLSKMRCMEARPSQPLISIWLLM
jgi:ribonucleoside-triphosphate reductase